MKTKLMKTRMPALRRSADELGSAVRSALYDVVPDWRMHEIRREIWRGVLRRLQQTRIPTR